MARFLGSPLGRRVAGMFLLAGTLPVVGMALWTLGSLEARAVSDAANEQGALARLGLRLVEDHIQQAEDRLVTVGRLLAEKLEDPSVGRLDLENPRFREAVVDRLDELVEAPDVYVELQYFSSGAQPRIVSQLRRGGAGDGVSGRRPSEFDASSQADPRGSLVQVPLRTGAPFRAEELTRDLGFPTYPISSPVISRGGTTLGALVAHVDLRLLSDVLEPLLQDHVFLRLVDGNDRVLSELGPAPEDPLSTEASASRLPWTLRVSESRAALVSEVSEVRRRALRWILPAVLFAILLGASLARWLLNPLSRLTRAAQSMELGNLAARSGVERSDELGQLAKAFDHMAQSLEHTDRTRSDFIANVSHELRTPLAGLSLRISNLKDGIHGAVDPGMRGELLRVASDVRRLTQLVNDLLELMRLEEGLEGLRSEDLDLAHLAREVIAGLQPLADLRSVELRVEGHGAVTADPAMVRRVLSNLIDNAIKWSPRGEVVLVRIEDSSFEVLDSGPGVQVDDPFERFTQGQRDGNKVPGVGLGLALVKRWLDLHGGSISYKDHLGTRFRVEL